MKKVVLILVTVVCAQLSFGQAEGKNAPASELPSSCPAGWCAYWQYVFDLVNFHKPRTGCTSGFGLCVKGHTESGCKPCRMLKPSEVYTKLENQKATCVAELKDEKLELRIPAAIKNDKAFAKEDMSLFFVEKGALSVTVNGTQKENKEGAYAVSQSGSEYVILIDLE